MKLKWGNFKNVKFKDKTRWRKINKRQQIETVSSDLKLWRLLFVVTFYQLENFKPRQSTCWFHNKYIIAPRRCFLSLDQISCWFSLWRHHASNFIAISIDKNNQPNKLMETHWTICSSSVGKHSSILIFNYSIDFK
jgi:hypothetical protein